MANYYVVSTAGTGGSGTIGAPWLLGDLVTIGSPTVPGIALTTLVAGDTLYFRDGDYHVTGSSISQAQMIAPTHSGTNFQPITLQAYPGEFPHIIVDGLTSIQDVFGSQGLNYIRFIGFKITPNNVSRAFNLGGTGSEVAYCELVGSYQAGTDNHDAILMLGALDAWIHHNDIHDQTGDSGNATGIKQYNCGVTTVEDNYIHGCTSGISDKDGGSSGDGFHQGIYRRNLLVGNIYASFIGPGQGDQSVLYIYDNVIDGWLALDSFNTGSQVYNNLLRVGLDPVETNGGSNTAIHPDMGGSASSFLTNIWNNIFIPATAGVWSYWNSFLAFGVGGPTNPLNYLDYNVYTGAPTYHFGGAGPPLTEYTLAQIRVLSLETHSIVDTAANIFVNQVAYVLKPFYQTAGRGGIYASFVGPGVSSVPGDANPITVAEILDTSRYGPQASLAQPDVLMMQPFTDTLGVFVIVPLYLNPSTTIGGPTLPTSVSTPPTWTKNGSPIVFDLVTFDAELRALVYQYPSWGHLLATDVLTMSAPQGWATTVGGDLGGTGSGGTSSAPLTVLNNVGLTVENQYDTVSREMPAGINVPPFNALGQPRANWCSRLEGWIGVITAWDSITKLPSAIGGAGVSAYIYRGGGANGIDSTMYPLTEGRWRLTYGDASPGVDATHHKLLVQLIGNTGWTEHIISAGTWSVADGCWHDIITEYTWDYPGGETSYIRLDLYSTAAGGAVVFPDMGNGQVELCVSPPSIADRNVAAPADYGPLSPDLEYLLKHEQFRPRAIRWMPASSTFDATGDSYAVYPADLDLRKADDFLWTTQTSTPFNIIKIEPVTSFDAIISYIGSPGAGTQAMTLANWDDLSTRVVMLCTTDSDHELRTNDLFAITGTTTVPNPVVDTGLTITANITTTTGPTTIAISSSVTLRIGTILQVGSEQMQILGILTATSISVSRGIRGTTGATHSSGAAAYVGLLVKSDDALFVTGARTFVISETSAAVNTNTTIHAEVNYTAPDCPTFNRTLPPNDGSVPYEFQAKTTNTIAVANGSETILWTNVSLMASDALVTEIVQNRLAPYLTSPLVTLIIELSNELWNNQFYSRHATLILYRTAPNPETAGTGFDDVREYIASRQNQINTVAKAAFVAAGKSEARVYNFQPSKANNAFVQAETTSTIIYCQANDIPIDYLAMGGYAGLTPEPWSLFWRWMSVADGGLATWSRGSAAADRAWARRVHMSYMRAWWWFSPFMGVAVTGAAQAMSWYKAGKSVADAGVGSATANSGLGKLCVYEGGTELDAWTNSDFVKPVAMEHDWAQDPYWHATETAYLAAVQGAAEMYRNLMPETSFPDATSATMGFLAYFCLIYVAPTQGDFTGEALYDVYDWQGQQPGYGASNVMGWDPVSPVFQTWQNESVRAQAIIDWNGGSVPPPVTSGKSSNFAILMAGM